MIENQYAVAIQELVAEQIASLTKAIEDGHYSDFVFRALKRDLEFWQEAQRQLSNACC